MNLKENELNVKDKEFQPRQSSAEITSLRIKDQAEDKINE